MPDVLNTDVYPLLDVAISDDFVDDDADSTWCNVVYDSSTSAIPIAGSTTGK